MSDGFLGRWARRKLEVKQEELARQARKQVEAPSVENNTTEVQSSVSEADVSALPKHAQEAAPQAPAVVLPTEADLDAVSQGGEIRNFMNPQVSGDLRNKAFKALFSQPQFNQMDFMDVYVDDYSVSKPLTSAMIDMMALGKQLLSRPDLEPPVQMVEQNTAALHNESVELENLNPQMVETGERIDVPTPVVPDLESPREEPRDLL